MRLEVKPAAKSPPECPSYVWRVWKDGREIGFGLCGSEQEAREQAELATSARNARRQSAYWEQVLADEGDSWS